MSRRDFVDDFTNSSLWSTVPAKRRFHFVKELNLGMRESHRLALTMNGVVDRSLEDAEGLQTSDFEGYQIFEEGDLAFKLIDLENIKTSRVGLVPRRGIMSPAYIRLRPIDHDNIYARFYYWYFYAAYRGNIFNGLGGGIRQSLNQTELLEFLVPEINYEDQVEISHYLEREVSRIDGLIARKLSFVELLNEKTLAYIDRCVTGQDRAGRSQSKTSMPWVPQIPVEWSVMKGKQLFREMARPVEEGDGIITAFRDGQVCLRTKRRTEGYTFAEKEVGYQHIAKGDLVIHTMDAFAGAIGVSEDDGKATGEYAACVPHTNQANTEYYAYVLRCMARRNYIYVLCPSVRERAPRFRFVRFAPVKLPVPPRSEQDEIVQRIKRYVQRTKVLVEKVTMSVELLREHRTALITAAVTGKFDVRNAA